MCAVPWHAVPMPASEAAASRPVAAQAGFHCAGLVLGAVGQGSFVKATKNP